MSVVVGSASSQHASVPLGATAHLFKHRGKGDDEGSGVVGGRRGNDWRLGVGGRVLDIGWGLERASHNHALEAGARIGGEASAHGCGRLGFGQHHQ
eukprot:scaffold94177_cov33-Phaeocystis_antarctica.AAC.1